MKLERQYKALQNKMIRLEKMGQKTIARNYKKTLDGLRITLSQIYQSYEIDGQLTFDEMAKYGRLKKLDADIYNSITNLYKVNSKAINGTLEGIVTDTYINSINIVNQVAKKSLKGIAKDINVSKTVNTEMAGLKWTERLDKHRVDAIYNIQKEIKLGLTQGDAYGTMANRLKGVLEVDIHKANTIVRTEGHRCHGQAKEDSFDYIAKQGIVFKEQWLSSEDEKVRSYHRGFGGLNGTIINRGELFHSPSGASGLGPGLMGSAKDDVNCRCIKILIL